MRDDHDTEHRANDQRHGPEEVPEPVYLFPVRDCGADAAEEGADLEVPDDGTVGDAREEELQERDGDEEPAADDDGEDADDEAANEERRSLARKQPRRNRANPREIDHGASPAERIRHFEYCLSSTVRPAYSSGTACLTGVPSQGAPVTLQFRRVKINPFPHPLQRR